MSKETKSKRRLQSPVAKLMGLDGLPMPPEQRSGKQQKKPPGNYLWRTISFEKPHRRVTSDENQSRTRSSKQHKKFNDVFEVVETSMKGHSSFSAHKVADLKLPRAEMDFVQKKFIDAKRLAIDAMLHDSKEFHDALEALDSNKELLLKYLEQPDSLFTRHLHDIKDLLPHSNHCHKTALKSSDDNRHVCYDVSRKSERRNPRKKHTISREHFNGHFSTSVRNYAALDSVKTSRIKVEEDEELAIFPKRIVILKPNLGKAQNSASIVTPSSHAVHSDCRKQSEFERTRIGEMEILRKKNYYDDVGLSKHKAKDSKENSKHITWRIGKDFDTGSMNSSIGITGHDRDESSFMGNDLVVEQNNSNEAFVLNGQCQSSSVRYKKSSMSRDSTKRLSDRWKMTWDSHDVGVVSRSCTLADMLAMPEKEIVPAHLEPGFGGEGSGRKFLYDNGQAECVEPFGISSRDGWKDICLEKLYRSKSLPASSTVFESPKTGPGSLSMDRFVTPKEVSMWERKETISESLCKMECTDRRNSRYRRKKSHSSICTLGEYNDPVLEICTGQNHDSDFKDDDPAERNLLVVEESTFCPVKGHTQVLENRMDLRVRSDNVIASSNDESQSGLSVPSMVEDSSYTSDREGLMPKERSPERSEDISFHLKSIPGLESPASSKEADQPSPVSVLEPPFTDDPPPGSDCFESLSADLHGLRMQLKLLKLETDAFAEGPHYISSDEDIGEGSIVIPEEIDVCKAEASWEFSYLTDVLRESSLTETDPDMFIAMLDSHECPVNPSIFEELEQRYADWSSQPRSERRLLFDRINLGILDIYQQFTDPYPWARLPRIQVRYNNEGLCSDLCKLLGKQVKKEDEDIVEKVVGKTTQCLVLGNEIDVIGKEIERLLLDELVAEAVAFI